MQSKIPFNRPAVTGLEKRNIREAIQRGKFSGDGTWSMKCSEWIESKLECGKALLTASGTHALEMAALLIDIAPGDEVIMPSYTFTSTANAFVLRGAVIRFIDIRPDTMNMNDELIERAVTAKTKAIVPVHYGGVGCEMDRIMAIAEKHGLFVVEDAAQALLASYRGRPLGTIGHLGCFSFHETKNVQCGEGGALVINKPELMERAEIIREKGTNRSKFWRGEVDKYTWVDVGSSYLPGELCAAFLYAQLSMAEKITADRMKTWLLYREGLRGLEERGVIETVSVPDHCIQNAHIYYIKVRDLEERTLLIGYMKERNISSVFHYIPLHSSEAGKRFGVFIGEDEYTTRESERLLRLPLYYSMKRNDVRRVVRAIEEFYS